MRHKREGATAGKKRREQGVKKKLIEIRFNVLATLVITIITSAGCLEN